MNEFDIINNYFAKLTGAAGLNLTDDAAVINDISAQFDIVTTMDTIVEGVHFFTHDRPNDIAKKVIRVNMSDLAAMSAKPYAILLSCTYNKQKYNLKWIESFCQGIKEDLEYFSVQMIGGDTVFADHFSFTVTAIGRVNKNAGSLRKNAQNCDIIAVTGTLGDAALGLHVDKLDFLNHKEKDYLHNRYLFPQPRLFTHNLPINGSIDISDGFAGDLYKLLRTAKLGAIINKSALPISAVAKKCINIDNNFWKNILYGGDDYELIITFNNQNEDAVYNIANKYKINLSKIGVCTQSSNIIMQDNGKNTVLLNKSFDHINNL